MLTLELRWFVPGAISDRELRSFADGGRIEARVDQYLLGTGDDLGIKRRGAAGTIEHKRRLAHTPVHVARDGVPLAGVAERWRKDWPEHTPAGDWMPVEKRRALRRVGSCRAELTLLRLSTPHLTLAVETANVDALDELLRAAGSLLRSHPGLAATFEQGESCGYPAWIGARWASNPQPTG